MFLLLLLLTATVPQFVESAIVFASAASLASRSECGATWSAAGANDSRSFRVSAASALPAAQETSDKRACRDAAARKQSLEGSVKRFCVITSGAKKLCALAANGWGFCAAHQLHR